MPTYTIYASGGGESHRYDAEALRLSLLRGERRELSRDDNGREVEASSAVEALNRAGFPGGKALPDGAFAEVRDGDGDIVATVFADAPYVEESAEESAE